MGRSWKHKVSPELLSHYGEFDESRRLESGPGALELVRTLDIIRRHAPDPPATVLDVGGGPGTYACRLAREGYRVHLLDPVPRHIEQAERASAAQPDYPLASARVGDARSLPYRDAVAEVALLLGPLYHLPEREARIRVLREAWRTLKPGGMLLVAAISRFASILDGLARGLFADPQFVRIVERDMADGQHRNPTGDPDYFTTAFFHRVEELETEVREADFEYEATLAVEGPAWMLQDFQAQWEDVGRRERLLWAARMLEDEPSIVGASAHFLALARKSP
jgi:ubiquinone/menaquinone biosynthesis C-methylase UbiE